MDLETLGFGAFFKDKADKEKPSEYQFARVAAVDKESFIIIGEHGECRAEPAGRLLYAANSPMDHPTAGDWVHIQYFDGNTFAVIHGIIPRKSLLKRKASGKVNDVQLIAANIDAALIVQSLDSNFNLQRLERYVVAAAEGGIAPIILLSKSDLLPTEEVGARIAAIGKRLPGVKAASFSNLHDPGVAAVRGLLAKGATFCLLGSSGVGKTTLLNNLLGEAAFKTRPVREKDDKGRHTTSRRQLTVLDNGAILIDTPGMREFGVLDAGSGIESAFAGIAGLSGTCRFHDCTHTEEPGCAVLAAVKNGMIEAKQYENYLKLTKEAEYHSMSSLEKRRKDRAFGKMVKSVKKLKGL